MGLEIVGEVSASKGELPPSAAIVGDESSGQRSYLRPGDYVEIDELIAGIRRITRSLGQRVGWDGPDALRALVTLRREIDDAVDAAVVVMRHDERYPASWTEIADALGVTQQATIQRYGHVGGLRQAGGQPGSWR